MEKIVGRIERDVSGHDFSLILMDPDDIRAAYQALLRRRGSPPLNEDSYSNAIKRKYLGDVIVVIAAGAALDYPICGEGLHGEPEGPDPIADVNVWRIPRRIVPENATGVSFGIVNKEIVVSVKRKNP